MAIISTIAEMTRRSIAVAVEDRLGDGVVPARVQRVAPGDPASAEPATAYDPVALYCFEGVLRTGRVEPAAGGDPGRDEPLVAPNQEGECLPGPPGDRGHAAKPSRHPSNSARRVANGTRYASRRARTIRSTGGIPGCMSRRQISLIRLRKRLRATAVDWNFGTISPIRGWPAELSIQITSRCPSRRLRPWSKVRRISADALRRPERGRRSSLVRIPRACSESGPSAASGPSSAGATTPPCPSASTSAPGIRAS